MEYMYWTTYFVYWCAGNEHENDDKILHTLTLSFCGQIDTVGLFICSAKNTLTYSVTSKHIINFSLWMSCVCVRVFVIVHCTDNFSSLSGYGFDSIRFGFRFMFVVCLHVVTLLLYRFVNDNFIRFAVERHALFFAIASLVLFVFVLVLYILCGTHFLFVFIRFARECVTSVKHAWELRVRVSDQQLCDSKSVWNLYMTSESVRLVLALVFSLSDERVVRVVKYIIVLTMWHPHKMDCTIDTANSLFLSPQHISI